MSQKNQLLDGGAHWRNLADTIEPSICGGDAAYLSNYFDRFFDIAVCIIIRLKGSGNCGRSQRTESYGIRITVPRSGSADLSYIGVFRASVSVQVASCYQRRLMTVRQHAPAESSAPLMVMIMSDERGEMSP